jgi:hypothetical protein
MTQTMYAYVNKWILKKGIYELVKSQSKSQEVFL